MGCRNFGENAGVQERVWLHRHTEHSQADLAGQPCEDKASVTCTIGSKEGMCLGAKLPNKPQLTPPVVKVEVRSHYKLLQRRAQMPSVESDLWKSVELFKKLPFITILAFKCLIYKTSYMPTPIETSGRSLWGGGALSHS